ncbi:hypothetical protein JCM11491_001328 [Sporobolomyces phaffii]
MARSPSPRRRSLTRSRSPSRSPTPLGDTIKVGKLSKNVMAGHLEEIFDVYGKIVDIDLPVDKKTGTHKGTAWIGFASSAAASKAAAQAGGDGEKIVTAPSSQGERTEQDKEHELRQESLAVSKPQDEHQSVEIEDSGTIEESAA